MTGPTEPRRGPRLILDLSSGTAIIDGERIELPQKELQVLVELAAHPGDVVSTPDLIEGVWPDVPGMTPNDLYSHVSRLRRRIKDGKRGRRLVRNRRGFGYALDLAAEEIRIVEGLATTSGPGHLSTVPVENDAPGEAFTDDHDMTDANQMPDVVTHEDVPSEEDRPFRRSLRPRLTTVVVIALIASLTVGGSWLVGYRLSQRGRAVATDPVPSNEPEGTPQPQASAQPESDNQTGGRGPRARGGSAQRNDEPSTSGVGDTLTQSSGDSPGSTRKPSSTDSKPSGKASKPKPPPPPPQPDAQLFHLHNPDTGDRYMTVSSSTSNQKQAAGYNLTVEGRVFTKQVDGTVAISLDDGSAYIYRSRGAAPESVSVTELYRLTKSGDLFYTKSSSTANQAEAQGWSRSLAGFVQ